MRGLAACDIYPIFLLDSIFSDNIENLGRIKTYTSSPNVVVVATLCFLLFAS